jgi:flagellar basal body-associated protein FliL
MVGARPQPRSSAGLIIGIVVGVVLLLAALGVGGLLYVQAQADDEPPPKPAAAPTRAPAPPKGKR